ncbi:MAG: NUDIX domain-containing protein [Desulfuromonadaceae bacterium]|nr:NUDIX domain-containing protein [Desulfuromonas sp.]MDY0185755.1 NUDIX domain-containing protein [Desulfuromonadaceae bacterium]
MHKMQRDVEVVHTTEEYAGFLKVLKFQLRHRLYNGEMSHIITRELVERGQAVAVLLYDPQADAVVLIEQFRIGALHDPDSAWMLEVVAGMVEQGESLTDVARRECHEESGCYPSSLHYIGRYYLTPGGSSEQIHIFYAEVDSSGLHGTLAGVEGESEDIRVQAVPWSEVVSLMDSGRILNATAMLALQWLRLHKCGEGV